MPDDAVKTTEDTLTVSLTKEAVVDQLVFPNDIILGSTGAPATVSFDITFTKTPGTRRHVRPTSADPLSPFNWAGEMWDATDSGTFSAAYKDGTFSAQGSFGSTQVFGEMGTERNGSFVDDDERADAAAALPPPEENAASVAGNKTAALPANTPKFRGRIPVTSLVH